MPYPAGPRLLANQTALVLGANAGRKSVIIQNQGAGATVFNYWPPATTADGWRVEAGGTLSDVGQDVHLGDWYGREVDGQGATLRVIES